MSDLFRVIYLFYDGIGIGQEDDAINPFARYAHSYLSALGGKLPKKRLAEGWNMVATDATLGSCRFASVSYRATALWTGINASQSLGFHMTGFPGPTLQKIIQQHSILKRFQEQGLKASFFNAYHNRSLQYLQKKPRMQSTSYRIQSAAGLRHYDLDDLEKGQALYMDYTHDALHRLYPPLAERFPKKSAFQSGVDFMAMTEGYHLSLHEFFLTDKAGHQKSWEMAEWCIRNIEDFLAGVISVFDPQNQLLLVSSDHGNLEDLTVKTHTLNQVPTFAYGKFSQQALQYTVVYTIFRVLFIDFFSIPFCT